MPLAAAKEKAPAKTIAFPQQESDLKPDPAARFGRLENGVRYVVLPNHEPRDRASLRLLILAGSLNEKDDQRGLAHFLEHMAFYGSNIADELRQKGVTDDEFNRAREPMLSATRQSLRDNGYWLYNVLGRAHEKPERLDWTRTRLADIEAITPAEISALAAKYLGRERASRATILPATVTPLP